MAIKLVGEGTLKISLLDQTSYLQSLVMLLVLGLIFGPLLFISGIVHPSYQIRCESKAVSYSSGCVLKSLYFFMFPWYTDLGSIQYAEVQREYRMRRNGAGGRSCGTIILTSKATASWAYDTAKKKSSFYLTCSDLPELEEIVAQINEYLLQGKGSAKEFNLPSLPQSIDQYMWFFALILILLHSRKRIEIHFDKNLDLVSVTNRLIFSSTKTYPLSEIKKMVLQEAKGGKLQLVMMLLFSRIALVNLSGMKLYEQKKLCQSLNTFLGL